MLDPTAEVRPPITTPSSGFVKMLRSPTFVPLTGNLLLYSLLSPLTKWHPDRWATNSSVAGEAKRRFQQIQEAYSVLSDQGKRSMYDAGFYDPTDEVDQGFSDFMQEMMTMMENVRGSSEGDSLEDLQKMFVEMVGSDGSCFSSADQTTAKRPCCSSPRRKVTVKRNSPRC